jgi:hypothetical protein
MPLLRAKCSGRRPGAQERFVNTRAGRVRIDCSDEPRAFIVVAHETPVAPTATAKRDAVTLIDGKQ